MLRTGKKIEDINYILDNLRSEDLEEIVALLGNNWRQKFIQNTLHTDFTILLSKNVPIAMGGFVPVNKEKPYIACVWLICSKYIKNNKMLLLKTLKSQVQEASYKFDIFYNYIYKSNFEAKKWLRKLGFCFDNPYPHNLKVNKDFEFFYKLNQKKER